MALFALFGVAAFLTWPIWIGPLVLTLVLRRDASRRELAVRRRLPHLAIALLPIADRRGDLRVDPPGRTACAW